MSSGSKWTKFKTTWLNRRRVQKTLVLLAFFLFFATFQNFNSLPISELRPTGSLAYARNFAVQPDKEQDLRKIAPSRPAYMDQDHSYIASPHSGKDLNSVSQDWMKRQAFIITGGAEERFLVDVNKRINRFFQFKPEDSSDDTGDIPSSSAPNSGEKPAPRASSLRFPKPTSMRFTTINRLQLDFGSSSSLSCSFLGDNLQWDFNRPLSNRFDVGLRHESTNSKSSVLLNYSW